MIKKMRKILILTSMFFCVSAYTQGAMVVELNDKFQVNSFFEVLLIFCVSLHHKK
jgi:hypothetical protein